MKKILLFVTVFILITAAAAADTAAADAAAENAETAADSGSDQLVSIALGNIDISDAFSGMFPSYVQLGIDYHGFALIEGKPTILRLLAGGARTSYTLWTDADGSPVTTYPADDAAMDDLEFAFWRGDLQARLIQEILPHTAAYAQWSLVGALPVENIGGAASTILTTANAAAYPDKDGMLANVLRFGISYDTTVKGTMRNGIFADLSVTAAPGFLLNELIGKTDFYQINGTIKAFIPLYAIPMAASETKRWLSVYLADRVQVDYTLGEAIPQLYQEYSSLGKKMRGFESTSLGVALTAVNNLELRVSGPQFGLFGMQIGYPRVHLFADAGFCSGDYFNNETAENGLFAASYGVEAALDLFDFLDVGYRYGFIAAGENIRGESSFGELFFFLHW